MHAVKSHAVRGIAGLVDRFRSQAQAQRELTPTCPSPIADTLDYAAAQAEQLLQDLREPTRLLSPDEWGAEQEPAVSGKTVRRYIARGELDGVTTSAGVRVPAGAVRREPVETAVAS